MSRRTRSARKSAARAQAAWAKVLRRRARATRAATAATAAALTLAGAGTAVATPHDPSGSAAGSAAGAEAMRAACPTPRPSSAPRLAAALGGTVFFTANDGIHGRELWKSDGTTAGTVLVKDIHTDRDLGSRPSDLTVMRHHLFFAADDGTNGLELWKSDGTTAGTVLVKDIHPGPTAGYPNVPASSEPYGLTALDGQLLFAANDGIHDDELWKSDGTAAGTVLVKDIAPKDGTYPSSYPSNMTVLGHRVLFRANDDAHGYELWKSDGSRAGTVLVKDINRRESMPDHPGSWPSSLTAVGGRLFFSANDEVHDVELWKSDGSRAGTVLVRDIATSGSGYRSSSDPGDLAKLRGQLFFAARDDTHGRELWKSDGSRAGTVMVKNIDPAPHNDYDEGPASSYPSTLTPVGRRLFFSADDGRHGRELWKSTGSRTGTVLVKDINSAGDSMNGYPYVTALAAVGGRLLFTADDGTHGPELWRSDGSRAGTVLVKDIRTCSGPDESPEFLTTVDGRMFFTADDGVHGQELWRSDGSRAGTVLVKDINTVTTP
jgi:ELWxxDGT repeat protein